MIEQTEHHAVRFTDYYAYLMNTLKIIHLYM